MTTSHQCIDANQAFKEKLVDYRKLVERGIEQLLPASKTHPERLHTAMLYSMQAGGKRIRPVLLLNASELFPSEEDPLPAAVAIECIHTYTLIHDDLPSIDNSNLRRGRPSCHTQFDEATALLAGDSLLTLAFQLLSAHYAKQPELAVSLIHDLSIACDSEHLIGGQMEDIANEGQVIDKDTLHYIHENKTSALIKAALKMGLRFCKPDSSKLRQIETIGYHVGMAFQIIDDILDSTSNIKTLGKPVGNDSAASKSTYVAMYGIEGAHEKAKNHTAEAIEATEKLGGNNHFLVDLIHDLEHRIH